MNRKGFTIIELMAVLIIMAILAGITVNISSKEIKEAELQDLVTNMLLIQAKVKISVEEVNFKVSNLNENNDSEKINNAKSGLIGDEISNVSDLYEYISDEQKNNPNNSYYYLSDEDLNNMGLAQLISEENNYYVYILEDIDTGNGVENGVEYEINDIIYTGGYTDSDRIYYSLSELEKLQNS